MLSMCRNPFQGLLKWSLNYYKWNDVLLLCMTNKKTKFTFELFQECSLLQSQILRLKEQVFSRRYLKLLMITFTSHALSLLNKTRIMMPV